MVREIAQKNGFLRWLTRTLLLKTIPDKMTSAMILIAEVAIVLIISNVLSPSLNLPLFCIMLYPLYLYVDFNAFIIF